MNFVPGISISNRAMGGFPLSVGTALAFESVFPATQTPYDPERKLPGQVEVSQYNNCYVNITTLFRNLSGAVDKDIFNKADLVDIATTILEEMSIIEQLFQEFAQSVKPIFYYSTYSTLESEIKRSGAMGLKLREPKTENQKFYQNRLSTVISILEKQTDKILKLSDAIYPDQYSSAFVITHQPYDLTDFNKFARLDLLESNTGVLKPRYLWNTKYHAFGSKSLEHLPFHKKLLLCFGDRVLIHPGTNLLRDAILSSSIARKWNPMTTISKIDTELSLDLRDPMHIALWNSIKA